jgi:hypothetical protein
VGLTAGAGGPCSGGNETKRVRVGDGNHTRPPATGTHPAHYIYPVHRLVCTTDIDSLRSTHYISRHFTTPRTITGGYIQRLGTLFGRGNHRDLTVPTVHTTLKRKASRREWNRPTCVKALKASLWDPESAGGSKEAAGHTAAFKACYLTRPQPPWRIYGER